MGVCLCIYVCVCVRLRLCILHMNEAVDYDTKWLRHILEMMTKVFGKLYHIKQCVLCPTWIYFSSFFVIVVIIMMDLPPTVSYSTDTEKDLLYTIKMHTYSD